MAYLLLALAIMQPSPSDRVEVFDRAIFVETKITEPQLLGFGNRGSTYIEREVVLQNLVLTFEGWRWKTIERHKVDRFPEVTTKTNSFRSQFWFIHREHYIGQLGFTSRPRHRHIEARDMLTIQKEETREPTLQ